jgi:hypothetical protein
MTCTCPCHPDPDEVRACDCCWLAGHWAETCLGQALTVGGHKRCTPGRCLERPPEAA